MLPRTFQSPPSSSQIYLRPPLNTDLSSRPSSRAGIGGWCPMTPAHLQSLHCTLGHPRARAAGSPSCDLLYLPPVGPYSFTMLPCLVSLIQASPGRGHALCSLDLSTVESSVDCAVEAQCGGACQRGGEQGNLEGALCQWELASPSVRAQVPTGLVCS